MSKEPKIYDVAVVERYKGDPMTDVVVRTCRPSKAEAIRQQFEDALEPKYEKSITYHVVSLEQDE